MEQKKRKLRIRIILGVAAFVLLTGTAVVMILLGYTPGIYRPSVRPESGQVNPYWTHQLGPDFFTGMQGQQPFEMVLQQWGVNDLLALTTDTTTFNEFTVSSPNVVFNPDSVVLMATVSIKNVSSVLSITARPAIDPDGQLNLNVQSATLGVVPVLGLVRRIGQEVVDEYLVGQDEQAYAGIARCILNNEPFEPVVSVSDYTMRLKRLTIEEGKIRVLIEPVKETAGINGPKVP